MSRFSIYRFYCGYCARHFFQWIRPEAREDLLAEIPVIAVLPDMRKACADVVGWTPAVEAAAADQYAAQEVQA